jgi:hypothetical protein
MVNVKDCPDFQERLNVLWAELNPEPTYELTDKGRQALEESDLACYWVIALIGAAAFCGGCGFYYWLITFLEALHNSGQGIF